MVDLTALREALKRFHEPYPEIPEPLDDRVVDIIEAAAQEFLRLMTPPVRCAVCDGKGWLDKPGGGWMRCDTCNASGWVGEARWHCTVRTSVQTCNPDRTGGGHQGCGWHVPIGVASDE